MANSYLNPVTVSATFAVVGFVVGALGGVWCRFVAFRSTDGFDPPIEIHFGLWSYQSWLVVNNFGKGIQIFDSCTEYPEYVAVDSSLKAARAFSSLALISGGFASFATLWKAFVHPNNMLGGLEGFAFLATCLFQGFVLLFMGSSMCKNNFLIEELEKELDSLLARETSFQDECNLSSGSNMTIAATLCWFAAGIVMCAINPPNKRTFFQPNISDEEPDEPDIENRSSLRDIHEGEQEPLSSNETNISPVSEASSSTEPPEKETESNVKVVVAAG